MNTFKIEISETLAKVIEIVCDTKEQAFTIVEEMYRNEEVVLSSEDYVSTEYEFINE